MAKLAKSLQVLVNQTFICLDCGTTKTQYRWLAGDITSACSTCKTITPHQKTESPA
jgi:RNA polymerase subunit RPABC4/transcription elongation factor Spt4